MRPGSRIVSLTGTVFALQLMLYYIWSFYGKWQNQTNAHYC